MLIAAPSTRWSPPPAPPRGTSSAITIGWSWSSGITAAVAIPRSVMNHSWYAWSLAFGASPSQRTSQRCRTLSAKIVTDPTRPPVETGIWMSRVAGPWMNVETVSSSAWTRATRPSRSVVSVPIVRYAPQPPPPPGKGGERCVHLPVPGPPGHRRFVRRGRRAAAALHHLSLLQMRRLAPPPPPAAQGVERPVARNRQYPGYKRPAAPVVLVDVTPHLHEHVAHHVLGLVFVLQNAKRQTQDPRCDKVEQLPERVLVPRFEAPLERALVLLTKTSRRGHLDCCPSSEPGRIQPRSCILKARTRRWDVGSLPS